MEIMQEKRKKGAGDKQKVSSVLIHYSGSCASQSETADWEVLPLHIKLWYSVLHQEPNMQFQHWGGESLIQQQHHNHRWVKAELLCPHTHRHTKRDIYALTQALTGAHRVTACLIMIRCVVTYQLANNSPLSSTTLVCSLQQSTGRPMISTSTNGSIIWQNDVTQH